MAYNSIIAFFACLFQEEKYDFGHFRCPARPRFVLYSKFCFLPQNTDEIKKTYRNSTNFRSTSSTNPLQLCCPFYPIGNTCRWIYCHTNCNETAYERVYRFYDINWDALLAFNVNRYPFRNVLVVGLTEKKLWLISVSSVVASEDSKSRS